MTVDMQSDGGSARAPAAIGERRLRAGERIPRCSTAAPHDPVNSRTTSGLLSTAGDLVFGGTADGFFFAPDAETGEELWHKNIGGRVHAGLMAFAVDGRQHVAIAAGNPILAFALLQDFGSSP